MTTPVQRFSSDQAFMPMFNGQAGTLASVIKTALVTGGGAQTVTINVTNGVATVTYPSAHGRLVSGLETISGASEGALNGAQRITGIISATKLTFSTTAADGPAAGTISAKAAGAGWMEAFSSGNTIVVKPSDIGSTGCFVRVDDTVGTGARVRAFESMSDPSTGIGPSPLDAHVAGGGYWPKSSTADAANRPWIIVADGRGCHLFVDPTSSGRYTAFYFGDIRSLTSGDAYGFLLTCNTSANQATTTGVPDGCNGYSGRAARPGAYLQRSHTGIGGALAAQRTGEAHNGPTANIYSGGAGYSLGGDSYPNGPGNALLLSRVEVSAQGVRGTIPGLYHARSAMQDYFQAGQLVDGTDKLLGKKLMAVPVGSPGLDTLRGTVFVDVTGDWSR